GRLRSRRGGARLEGRHEMLRGQAGRGRRRAPGDGPHHRGRGQGEGEDLRGLRAHPDAGRGPGFLFLERPGFPHLPVFDVGFSELMVIAVVALIVIGPERLPRVARTLGHLFGRLQRYVNDVKADINREIELDELRKFKSTFEDAARGFEGTVNQTVDWVQSEVSKAETELNSLKKIEDTATAPSGAPQDAPPRADAPTG